MALSADAHGPLTDEWNFSGAAFGWSFRLKKKKRTIVYMTPCRAHFLASFALGDKACRAAQRDLDSVESLVAIKVAN